MSSPFVFGIFGENTPFILSWWAQTSATNLPSFIIKGNCDYDCLVFSSIKDPERIEYYLSKQKVQNKQLPNLKEQQKPPAAWTVTEGCSSMLGHPSLACMPRISDRLLWSRNFWRTSLSFLGSRFSVSSGSAWTAYYQQSTQGQFLD